MQICIDVPDADARRLNEIAQRQGRPRNALLCEAITDLLNKHRSMSIDDGFALWSEGGPSEPKPDGMEYQRRLREEW